MDTELDTTAPEEVHDWVTPPDMTGHPPAVDADGQWLIQEGKKVIVEKWTRLLSSDGSSVFFRSDTYRFQGFQVDKDDTLLLHDTGLTRTIRIPLSQALARGWKFWFPTKRRARKAKPKATGDVPAKASGRKGRTVYESKRRGIHCLWEGRTWGAPPETAAVMKMKVVPQGGGVFELPDGSKETWSEID